MKSNLHMREIKQTEISQSIELLNYVFQVNLSINKDRLFVSAKSTQFDEGVALGWFDGDKLVAQILNLPFEVNIHNRVYKMGGITAVGTYPEYSRHGLMHKLIYASLEQMKKDGYPISYLFPYSIPYYRKKGFEIMSDIVEYQIRDTQIPHYDDIPGQVRRLSTTHDDLKDVYHQFAMRTHGAMIRNDISWNEKYQEDYWEEKFIDSDANLQAAVYYDEDGNALGYMFYRIMEENFYIDELITLKEVARKALWNFVYAHQSMVYKVYGKTTGNEAVAFLMQDSEIKQSLSPYFMARIVDLKGFVEQFPFLRADFHMRWAVSDPLAKWNHGTFEIASKEGNVEVQKISDQLDGDCVQMTVQTLITMLLGYLRPTYLHNIERLKGDASTIALLENIIPTGVPTFVDYF
ncbi:GNAT family N-acetyltransferase [Rummeliibacillus pycnus]|uniref:GNAT family N-acetyltransferase n=1 Tax=Rummeliibacillus pycnus TaxID=101070 RepID=UPI000C9B914F|nr:GNAT family N-acetyltransferase [Rummeliibacillus pycnus]